MVCQCDHLADCKLKCVDDEMQLEESSTSRAWRRIVVDEWMDGALRLAFKSIALRSEAQIRSQDSKRGQRERERAAERLRQHCVNLPCISHQPILPRRFAYSVLAIL